MKNMFARLVSIGIIMCCCMTFIVPPGFPQEQAAEQETRILFDMLLGLIRDTKQDLSLNIQSLQGLSRQNLSKQRELEAVTARLASIDQELQRALDSLTGLAKEKVTLETIHKQLTGRLKDLGNQIAALEKENQGLADSLAASEENFSRLTVLQKINIPYSGTLVAARGLTQDLSNLQENNRQVNQERVKLEADLNRATSDVSGLTVTAAQVQEKLQTTAEKIKEDTNQMQDMAGQLEKAEGTLSGAGQKAAGLADTVKQSRSLTQQLADYQQAWQQFINKNVAQRQQLQDQVEQVKTEKQRDVLKISDEIVRLKAAKEEQLAQLKSQIAQLKNQNDNELTRLKAAKEQEISQLRGKSQEEVAKIKSACEQDLLRVSAQTTESKGKYDDLVNKLNAQIAASVELKQAKNLKEDEIEKLSERLTQLACEKDNEITRLKNEQSQDKSRFDAQARTNEELLKLKNQAELALIQLKEEFAAHKTGKEQELKGLNADMGDFKAKKEAENLRLDSEIKSMQRDSEYTRELMHAMTQENDIYKAQSRQYAAKLKEAVNQVAALKQQNQKLIQQNAIFKDEYVALTEKAGGLKQENQELTRQAQGGTRQARAIQELPGAEIQTKAQEPVQELRTPGESCASLKTSYRALEKRYKEAVKENEYLKRQYAAYPDDSKRCHYNLGVLYTQNKDYKRAIVEFERVLGFDPNDSESHYNLGVIYGEYMGNRAKALEHFQSFLKLSPNDPDSERVRRYVATSEVLQKD